MLTLRSTTLRQFVWFSDPPAPAVETQSGPSSCPEQQCQVWPAGPPLLLTPCKMGSIEPAQLCVTTPQEFVWFVQAPAPYRGTAPLSNQTKRNIQHGLSML